MLMMDDAMKTMNFRRLALYPLALALGGAGLAGAAMAQDYASAKAAGQIGEKPDGYVAAVGAGTAELRRIADDINIKRKAVYAEKAQTQHATVEEYAFTTGCRLIAQTQPGEKYQSPDGAWQTRGAAAPVRDPRCP